MTEASIRAVIGTPAGRWPAGTLQPCGTQAAYQRHRRRGEPIDYACRRANARDSSNRRDLMPGAQSPDLRVIRNGIPFRPYRYGGSGADAFTGEVVP